MEKFCEANPDDPDVILAEYDFASEEMTVTEPDDIDRAAELSKRIAWIDVYFGTHMMEIEGIGLPIPASRWQAEAGDDPLGLFKPYGWMPAEGAEGVMRYCPQIIARQTMHLTDPALESYLSVVGFWISMQLTHRGLPPLEREALIETTLSNIDRAGLDLMKQVQIDALFNDMLDEVDKMLGGEE